MKSKVLHTLILSFIMLALSLSASNLPSDLMIAKLTGIVVTAQGQPVIGAYTTIDENIMVTSTDLSGKFEFSNIMPGEYTIHISALGFREFSQHIVVSENSDQNITITLAENELVIPEVVIIGKSDRLFSSIPGSVAFINKKEIAQIHPVSGNEVFRKSPGVHVVDEEGAGMRINIGIRGLDPDRSRSVLVMEDGIPVALAPYGEPEMYYSPPIDRMSGVEILKGSGQILYGPQTIGGVVNYLTAQPPAESSGKVRLQLGQGGYINSLLQYGNTHGKAGYHVSFLKKRADKLLITGFDITDINGKIVLNLNEKSSVTFKAGFYDETSNSTYIGQTQTMYDLGKQDNIHMAPDDLLTVRRYSASLNHEYKWSPKTKLKTTLYAYTTSRNWRRQDFVSNPANNAKPSNWTGVTWGDESVVGGAVYMRNSTGNRNRQFEVAAAETRLEHQYKFLNTSHTLKTGVRYLYEKALEQRINGSKYDANSGALVEDESRPGNAISAYIHQSSEIKPNFHIHFGARLESFNYGRDIYRRTFNINGQNLLRDTFINQTNEIHQLIPGAGFTWRPGNNYQIFGGIHTGFAPPRTKDAISNVGEVYNLSAEKSINSELGFRSSPTKGVKFELTGFSMLFSNQIIPVSESSGGTGTGLVNGGSTMHNGIESALSVDISEIADWSKNSLSFHTNVTYIDAHFTGDRQQDGIILHGNKTPYAPSWLLNAAIQYEHVGGFTARLGTNYVSGQYADELNTYVPTPDGRIGYIPAYHTLDGNVGYQVKKWNTTFTISVKNITNERYIASRRPQGIRIGLPRWIMLGGEYNF